MAEAGPEHARRMETAYLKRCFGTSLAQALAEVAMVQPSDPIEYLAHWLHHHRKVTEAQEEGRQEEIRQKEEYENSLKETQMLKEEEYRIQQEYEKSHQLPLSGAVSTKETMIMQESTKPLENEALNKDCVPGTSSMTLEVPQQIPSSDSPDQTDRSVKTPPETNY